MVGNGKRKFDDTLPEDLDIIHKKHMKSLHESFYNKVKGYTSVNISFIC